MKMQFYPAEVSLRRKKKKKKRTKQQETHKNENISFQS